ncbi:lipocalin-like domain-containing protein [Lysobacter sp. BMK333-48F3]|uniref:lipocalin-like domain-containing protein n=1 Tax=Lysobacter sp. BMK333-48F3 TaxID=2867962 RepID=UPI001C8BADCC|nr:lipocalin-like domain-containing protein [Lysobacter sp. BMK333-48F3]MBX9400907.1 lipocalin-like domain-containing protein [Lysobacter sp. BMK333-48F3]
MKLARLRGPVALWSALALCPLPFAAVAAGVDADALVGTWKVETIADTDASGKVTHPYGERPEGYIVYDPTGRLHVQVMRTPATPRFASGDDAKGTDAEVRAAYDGYVAYFGRYRVDAERSTVVHQVVGSLMPSYTGTDQPRPFKLDGDVLTIEGDSEGVHFLRRFRRVK